jgi:hypothetical protein
MLYFEHLKPHYHIVINNFYVVKNSVVVVDQTTLERSQMPHMGSVEQEPETHSPVVASL